ncbi:PQQ-binding-like beta-propeller repeat protein [Croceitalea rosinachiae]|uniref:PQQ-binding-like beta-propeller repeat protein n=1 Tax=Croceitalea rosinachiae TaxID=3075596 RepID=A0ABU3ABS3_9FLAO|nr:PQQ-binding-like beta-propeller repeat protein [Croceitalea sp. F388]MDT0606553.1 PQQ-binding-like beta-propeller repeat protein [Croceitalea sp. F388]
MKRINLFLILGTLFLPISCKKEKPDIIISESEHTTWSDYLGDSGRSHFSTLEQIDTVNVTNLELAWSFKSGGLEEGRTTQIQTNPIIIRNTLFGVNAAIELFAVNAATGKQLWKFEPPIKDNSGLGLNRGLSFWQSNSEESSRVFFSSGSKLFAVNIETGKAIVPFGSNGSIDLRDGLGRDPERLSVVANTPGAIYQNTLVMGTRVGEGPGSSPGHIRAYNVLTGEILWTFHTIPQPGEFGYESWPEGAYKTVGGANSWAGIAMDQERGIAYIPTGSAAFDWYGGDRHGENLFANSLLALDAKTGERIWHFQMVHHDMWDRDLPAPPNLFEMNRYGEKIPAVAQVTKSGHVFIFNRLTGEPLFPIEEKEYPSSVLQGEQAHPTQPLPTKPLPFAKQLLNKADLYAPNQPAFVDDFVDKDQNINPPTVLDKFKQITSKGQFIPIDTTGVLLYPGADGGAEWGGAAMNPNKGIMYVNSNEMAWIVRMKKVGGETGETSNFGESLAQIHCARCHGGKLQGLGAIPELQNVKKRFPIDSIQNIIQNGKGAMPGMPNLSDSEINGIANYISGIAEETDHRVEESAVKVPYAVAGFGRFKDDRGFPVMNPPWGTLNAIDLNTGEYIWKVPLGNEETLNDPNYPVSGTENYGGPVITAGGVLFIAATKDEKFRAYNMRSGSLLWETNLPAGGYATPATYQIDGKQYIVIACGGGKMGTKSGDEYRAYALPD